jgi:hypothetical protein
VADFLQIPGEVEYEELFSYQYDQKTVVVTIALAETAQMLMQASAQGRNFEHVTIMGAGVTLALDNVYVSHFSTPANSGSDPPIAQVGFDAAEIRFVT